ncbi:unnamed protein product [Linum trigynum]|uniref:Uncharacterized protein n=1 Tax=Linum trigynum TaxID=586398 RepID=A0AAV2D9P1_9ROSI
MSKPNLRHQFVQDLRRGAHRDRFQNVLACKFGQHHYWSKRELEKLNCYEHLSPVVANKYWRRLLSILGTVYHELVLEFYTTFKHAATADWKDEAAVQFRLGGEPRSMSYDELADALGLNLVNDRDYITEIAEPDRVDFGRLYFSLARPHQLPFKAGKTKASTLQLENRLLHHLLTKSYTPASDSASAITKRSLYFIKSMRQRDHPLHLGSVVARTFKKSASELKRLHCTPLITCLAEYFQISLQGCTEQGGTTPFGRATITKMLLLREERGVMWIEGFPQPQILEAVQQEAPEGAADEEVQPEDVDDTAAARPTTFEYRGGSSSFPGQDYFTSQFEQLRLQNQQIIDHQMQFQQQYAALQAEYHKRMASYDERLDQLQTQQGVTLAHIERERRHSRRMQEVQQHLLQLLPGEQPVWRTPWEDSPLPPPPADGDDGADGGDAFMNDIVFDLDNLGDE